MSINAQSHIHVKVMDALGVPRADIVAHEIGGELTAGEPGVELKSIAVTR